MSDSGHVSRKRARVDSEEDSSSDESSGESYEDETIQDADVSGPRLDSEDAQRDEAFWFSDGTVILVAQSIEFRVYGGLIEDQSPVLKDLISQPHSTRLVQLRDQLLNFPCPVVRLADDPEDLRHVLRLCMPSDKSKLYHRPLHPSFRAISAAILLGEKYGMTDLRMGSIEYLKSYYPSDYVQWTALKLPKPPGFSCADVIDVMSLARSIGELTILPSALLWWITKVDVLQLVRGYKQEDGTQHSLTDQDIALCLKAKPALIGATVGRLISVFDPTTSSTCTSRCRCHHTLRYATHRLTDHASQVISGNPFGPYRGLLEGCPRDGKLCTDCSSMLEDRDRKERVAIWKRLPDILGVKVPGWKELVRVKPICIGSPAS